jgi:hypothetical protein
MTEAEWLSATDYLALLIYLRGEGGLDPGPLGVTPGLHCSAGFLAQGDPERTTRRKLGLFAADVARRWDDLPLDEASRRIVAAYRAALDGRGSWDEFGEVLSAAYAVEDPAERPRLTSVIVMWSDDPHGVAALGGDVAMAAADLAAGESLAETYRDADNDDLWEWSFAGPPNPVWQATRAAVEGEYAPLLRCVVGNPFRPVAADPAWRTSTVVALAEAVYADRAWDRLPILADALEDAGCTDPAVLGHLRGPGPHARGCWAVDLLLGKG